MIKEYKKKDGSKAYLAQVYLGIDSVTGKKKAPQEEVLLQRKKQR